MKTMTKEDAVVVLETMSISYMTCRTEKEALEVAKECLIDAIEAEKQKPVTDIIGIIHHNGAISII